MSLAFLTFELMGFQDSSISVFDFRVWVFLYFLDQDGLVLFDYRDRVLG